MRDNYRNDVDVEYKKSLKNETILSILFVLIIIFSVVNIFFVREFIIYFLLFLNLVYVILSFYDSIISKNRAESERRKTLLANAFSINLTSKKTNGYYNNNLSPSIKKLGVDSFESTLFTKKNLSMMIISEGVKTFIIFLLWLIIITKFNDKELFYTLTQTFFSFEILFKFIKIVYYYIAVDKIYDDFYHLFITKKYNDSEEQALVLEYVMNYECLKTYCHILLSNKNFKKINEKLSVEWENIYSFIK